MAQKANLIITLKDKASKGIKRIGGTLKKFGKALIPSRLAVAALTAVLGLSIREFAKFEKKLIDVGNLFGATKDEIRDLSDGVLEISTRVPVAAQDLAESLFDVVSAGVAVSEALIFLETSAKLAVAGVTSTKVAVDGLTSVINAYGLAASDAEEISDKFFAAQRDGKTTIEELSKTIGTVAPIAAKAGIGIDELLGATAALTKQGIKTDNAVVQIRAAITSIIKPSKEATEEAEKMGIEFDAVALRSKGLAGFLKDVDKATEGNIEKLAKLFPNVRAINGVLALSTKNFKELDAITRNTADAFGLVDDAAKKQRDSLGSQFTLVLSNIRAAFFETFGAESGIGEAITNSLKFINKNFKTMIANIKILLIDVETNLKIFSASFIRLLSKPFSFETYKTIFKNFVKGILNAQEKILSGISGLAKKALGLTKDAIQKDLKENQTLEEKILKIKEDAAARKREILEEAAADRAKASEKTKEIEQTEAEDKLERDKEIAIKIFEAKQEQLKIQQEVDARRKIFAEDTAAALVASEGSASQRIGGVLKDRGNKQLDAIAIVEIEKALIEAPGTFGASLLKIPIILAALTAGKAAVGAIQFHDGGLVGGSGSSGTPTTPGRSLRINERNAVVQTGERVLTAATDSEFRGLIQDARSGMGSQGPTNVILKVDGREIARATARHNRTFQRLNKAGSV